jgi:hypothetical protein
VLGIFLLAAFKLTLRLELGPEYDSNANRAEVVQGAANTDVPTGSFLARSTVRGTLSWRKGRNLLRASGLLGGKVYFNPDVQDQNTLVGQLGLEDRVRPTPWLELGLAGDYYDVGQQTVNTSCSVVSCDRHRDFRSGSALGRISFLDDPGEITFLGGYRGFVWKPDPAFDFHAGQATVIAAVRLFAGPAEREHEIDIAASYHVERRLYLGARELNMTPPGTPLDPKYIVDDPSGAKRADWFHEGALELTWVRVVLVSLSYAVQLDQSDSFGQSLLRHLITAKLSARLPWELYLTLKGQLLVNRYLDPVLLDRQVASQTFVSIEDENRNALIADIERPIGHSGVAIEARYSFYTNELGSTPASFQRHVVYLGVSYHVATK